LVPGIEVKQLAIGQRPLCLAARKILLAQHGKQAAGASVVTGWSICSRVIVILSRRSFAPYHGALKHDLS